MKNRSYDVNGKSNLGYVDHENNTSPEGVFSTKQGINMFNVKIVSDNITLDLIGYRHVSDHENENCEVRDKFG